MKASACAGCGSTICAGMQQKNAAPEAKDRGRAFFLLVRGARFLTSSVRQHKNHGFDDEIASAILSFDSEGSDRSVAAVALPDGVMVAHGPLKPLVLVRSQVGQPLSRMGLLSLWIARGR